MAEIPVEKKDGFPWWLLLLGALLLGLLLWMFLGADDDADVVTTTTPATAVNGAIDMDDLRVTNVTGDMSFYAEDDMGEEYYIVFDETRTPNTAREGRLDIDNGDIVDIMGTVRSRDYSLPNTVRADIPSGESTFIFASEVIEQ